MHIAKDRAEGFRWAALVGLAVYLLGVLGILLQREAHYIASLWPANAVAIALLLGRAKRDWPLGLAACAAGNMALNFSFGNPLLVGLGYTGVNVLETAVGVFLVSRLAGHPTVLSDLRRIGCFILCAGLLVPGLTAFAGAWLGSHFYGAEYWSAWRTWWIADSVSVGIFAPPVIAAHYELKRLVGDQRRFFEFAALLAATLVVTVLTFSSSVFPLVYLTFPFLVVAGIRFGVLGAGACATVVALAAVWLAIHGGAQAGDMAGAILEVQVFLGVSVAAALAVAVVLQENRAAMRQLGASESRFRQLVEHASDAIFVHDLNGNFVDVNYQACKSLGYERDELLRLKVHDVELERPETDEDSVWQRLQEGTAVTLDGTHRRKDGTTFPVELRVGLLTEDARPMVVAMARDVTARRQAEAHLHRAKEAAEEASRAKSAFLANTSHELRTPLNAIIGYSELLEEETAANGHGQYAADLSRVKAAGHHLLDVITGILDLSKVEAGRVEADIRAVHIGELLEQAGAAVEPLARRNENALTVSCDSGIGEMLSDPVKLRQILLNLLSNAAKFTRGGKITLSAAMEAVGDAQWLKFEVADTGIGIAPEKFDTLFDSFTQADSSATRSFGGTGLGLALSRRYCELLGGSIAVDSRPGEGSVFTVRLPTQTAAPARTAN